MEENKSHFETLLEKLIKAINHKYFFHSIKFVSLSSNSTMICLVDNSENIRMKSEDSNLCRALEKLAEQVLLAPEPKKEDTPVDELKNYLSQHNLSKVKPTVLGTIVDYKINRHL